MRVVAMRPIWPVYVGTHSHRLTRNRINKAQQISRRRAKAARQAAFKLGKRSLHTFIAETGGGIENGPHQPCGGISLGWQAVTKTGGKQAVGHAESGGVSNRRFQAKTHLPPSA